MSDIEHQRHSYVLHGTEHQLGRFWNGYHRWHNQNPYNLTTPIISSRSSDGASEIVVDMTLFGVVEAFCIAAEVKLEPTAPVQRIIAACERGLRIITDLKTSPEGYTIQPETLRELDRCFQDARLIAYKELRQ